MRTAAYLRKGKADSLPHFAGGGGRAAGRIVLALKELSVGAD
ncbi:hypothetical protein [Muricoccus radiodurans]